jgi:hypothetical protein
MQARDRAKGAQRAPTSTTNSLTVSDSVGAPVVTKAAGQCALERAASIRRAGFGAQTSGGAFRVTRMGRDERHGGTSQQKVSHVVLENGQSLVVLKCFA